MSSGNASQLELMYATGNASKCQSCKTKIVKDTLRIGVAYSFHDRDDLRKWYHMACFTIPKKYVDIDPKEIPGYYDLKKSDKLIVISAFEEPAKKPSASELVANLESNSKSQQSVKSKQPESKKDTKPASQQPTRVQPKRNASAKLRNNKPTYSTDEEDEDEVEGGKSDDYDDDDSGTTSNDNEDEFDDDSDGSEYNGKRRTRAAVAAAKTARSRSLSRKSTSKSKSPPARTVVEQKKTKSKLKQKSKKPSVLGYTSEQLALFKEYVVMFEKKTAEYLKQLLGANLQSKSGTKDELIIKCADGKVLGQIPMCTACGGGKLRFSYTDGTYKCPGYMDDDVFQHCSKKFSLEEIKREKWVDDVV